MTLSGGRFSSHRNPPDSIHSMYYIPSLSSEPPCCRSPECALSSLLLPSKRRQSCPQETLQRHGVCVSNASLQQVGFTRCHQRFNRRKRAPTASNIGLTGEVASSSSMWKKNSLSKCEESKLRNPSACHCVCLAAYMPACMCACLHVCLPPCILINPPVHIRCGRGYACASVGRVHVAWCANHLS